MASSFSTMTSISFRVIRALDMETTCNMLELVETIPSTAALTLLKSAVLRQYITSAYRARDKLLQERVVDGCLYTDLLRCIYNTTGCPKCTMNRSWFINSFQEHLCRKCNMTTSTCCWLNCPRKLAASRSWTNAHLCHAKMYRMIKTFNRHPIDVFSWKTDQYYASVLFQSEKN